MHNKRLNEHGRFQSSSSSVPRGVQSSNSHQFPGRNTYLPLARLSTSRNSSFMPCESRIISLRSARAVTWNSAPAFSALGFLMPHERVAVHRRIRSSSVPRGVHHNRGQATSDRAQLRLHSALSPVEFNKLLVCYFM